MKSLLWIAVAAFLFLACTPQPSGTDIEKSANSQTEKPQTKPPAQTKQRPTTQNQKRTQKTTKQQAAKSKEKALLSKLAQAKFKADRELAEAKSIASNIPNYLEGSKKFRRQAQAWRVYSAIPVGPHVDELMKALEQLAQKFGFKMLNPIIKIDKKQPPPLPDTVQYGKEVDYSNDHVRGIVLITFTLDKIDIGQLEKWFEAVKQLDRLVLVRRIKASKKGFVINLESYFFHDFTPPMYRVDPKSVDYYLRSEGIDKELDRLRILDKKGYLYAIEQSVHEYNQLIPAIQQALDIAERNRIESLRHQFFRRKFSQVKLLGFTDVY